MRGGRESLWKFRRRRGFACVLGAMAVGALIAVAMHSLSITSFAGQIAVALPLEGVFVVAALLWLEQPWKG